ncbi:MAG: hypothetical protein RLY86_2461, partial [Pseudomonadota bacterium]
MKSPEGEAPAKMRRSSHAGNGRAVRAAVPLVLLLLTLVLPAQAEPTATGQAEPAPTDLIDHSGIAMHGDPALPPGFAHFPYTNPEAPQGGQRRESMTGTFDSLNPYALRGKTHPYLFALSHISLLAR